MKKRFNIIQSIFSGDVKKYRESVSDFNLFIQKFNDRELYNLFIKNIQGENEILDTRASGILSDRIHKNLKYTEISLTCNISATRVRQIYLDSMISIRRELFILHHFKNIKL